MGTGNVFTTLGKKLSMHRAFESVPTYTVPGWFKVGTGTTTPVVGDTAIQTPVVRHTGTNTSTSSFKLIDSVATFQTDGVQVGDHVRNTTDATIATVASVDSEIQLTLNADIFLATSKAYSVDFTKTIISTYPSFDDTNLVITNRAILLTTECNGSSLTEFGLFNSDTTPRMASHSVYTAISKTVSVQVIYVEKDQVT